MSTDAVQLRDSDVPGAGSSGWSECGINPARDLPRTQHAQPVSGIRMRESSLSPRPFLLSSRTAWIVLDVAVTLIIAALTQLGHRRFHASLQSGFSCMLAGLPFSLFVLVLAQLSGLYRKNTHLSPFIELTRILLGVVPAGLALYGLQKLWGSTTLRSDQIVRDVILAGAAMFLNRALWRRRRDRLYQRNIALRNFLIVGADEVGRDTSLYLASLRSSGYRFAGFVSMCEPTDDAHAVSGEDIVGEIHNVIEIARSRFIDEIIFSRRPSTPGVLSRIIRQAQSLGISVRLIPSLTETLIDRTDVQYIGDLPTIAVFQARQRPFSLLIKRAMDVLLATAASILLLPLMLAIAIAIKLQSPGPVFYLSKRIGHKGRAFTCYKFRTMVENAAAMQDKLTHLNERSGVLFKISNDPRITPVGAILRKYSLDELPQLWNVFCGDMSVVGPRPSLGSEVAQYEAGHLRRLDAVPGITGLWQVEARQDPSFENYVSLDSKYIDDWSLRLDLRILLQTVNAVIRGTGS
jgi:exopolysaccharide biosynthesis polyprenyl glycosylphosphotransferase